MVAAALSLGITMETHSLLFSNSILAVFNKKSKASGMFGSFDSLLKEGELVWIDHPLFLASRCLVGVGNVNWGS